MGKTVAVSLKKGFFSASSAVAVEKDSAKTVYLEVLRVIAIFGVFFCHTGYDGVHHYARADNAVNYWFGILLLSLSQFCVPLFFMITGALLLKREESISYIYKHFSYALSSFFAATCKSVS